MRSRRTENEDPSSTAEEEENSDTSEGKEDASGETQVPKSKLENGSDSDSDLGSPSDYKLQPVSRKRTNQESPAVKSAAKKSKPAAGSSSLGRSSTRLWSDEDEVTLLKRIIKYNKSTGHTFNADLSAFYRFMEGRLGIDVTKDQLVAKTRRLKAKFFDALKKRGNGKDPEFSKPHDGKMFKLSKKIWGGSHDIVMDGENSSVPKNGKSLKKGENSKKRHAYDKEKDKMNTDSDKIVEVVLDEKKDSGKIVEVVLDEKKDTGKIIKKGKNSKKQHAVEVEMGEKEPDNGRSVKKKDSGKILEVVLDKKMKDSGKIAKKGKTVRKHVREVDVDEKKKDEREDDAKEEEMAEGVDFSKYPFLSCLIGNLMSSVPSMVPPESGVSSALKRIGSIGDGKTKELDDKCKSLIMKEAAISLKKLALVKEQMGMSFHN